MRQKSVKMRHLGPKRLAAQLKCANARIAELEKQLRHATVGCLMKEARLRAMDISMRLMAAG